MDPSLLIDIIAYSAIIPIGLFVYFYGTRPWKGHRFLRRPSTLWRTTAVGRTLMYKAMAWFVYLVFIAASIMWQDWPGRVYMRGAIYIAIVTLFWRLFFILRHVQKQPRSDEQSQGLNLDSDIENTKDPRRNRK